MLNENIVIEIKNRENLESLLMTQRLMSADLKIQSFVITKEMIAASGAMIEKNVLLACVKIKKGASALDIFNECAIEWQDDVSWFFKRELELVNGNSILHSDTISIEDVRKIPNFCDVYIDIENCLSIELDINEFRMITSDYNVKLNKKIAGTTGVLTHLSTKVANNVSKHYGVDVGDYGVKTVELNLNYTPAD